MHLNPPPAPPTGRSKRPRCPAPALILAAIYPVIVWFLIYRLRRTWPGFVLAIVAGSVVWALAPTIKSFVPKGGEVISVLIYAEAALVSIIGLWIATLRRPPNLHVYCPSCHYDLEGLTPEAMGTRCPECGELLPPRERPKVLANCPTCDQALTAADLRGRGPRCPTCATVLPTEPAARFKPTR